LHDPANNNYTQEAILPKGTRVQSNKNHMQALSGSSHSLSVKKEKKGKYETAKIYQNYTTQPSD
jgi:ribosomal protein S8E